MCCCACVLSSHVIMRLFVICGVMLYAVCVPLFVVILFKPFVRVVCGVLRCCTVCDVFACVVACLCLCVFFLFCVFA